MIIMSSFIKKRQQAILKTTQSGRMILAAVALIIKDHGAVTFLTFAEALYPTLPKILLCTNNLFRVPPLV